METETVSIMKTVSSGLTIMLFFWSSVVLADENASNPLAAVTNTDIRVKYFDLGGSIRRDYYVDGATMATPNLKIKYELHYWNTDVTGTSENNWESIHLKSIYFPESMIGKFGEWKYKLAVGGEVIVDFGNDDQGIGSGSDQIAPLVGLALSKGDTSVIPLAQHYTEYSGPDVNKTSFRLIVLQAFPDHKMWVKLDNKVPVDWENDNEIPASIEAQIGKNFSPGFGAYIDGLLGVGGDRDYDWGIGIGLRFNY
ncbi:MAG: hypothetical protein GY792_31070 [Gammaproteobacteria bacterium]|nr:hypothetical protein [Gammaproteobacteria bacterium]